MHTSRTHSVEFGIVTTNQDVDFVSVLGMFRIKTIIVARAWLGPPSLSCALNDDRGLQKYFLYYTHCRVWACEWADSGEHSLHSGCCVDADTRTAPSTLVTQHH